MPGPDEWLSPFTGYRNRLTVYRPTSNNSRRERRSRSLGLSRCGRNRTATVRESVPCGATSVFGVALSAGRGSVFLRSRLHVREVRPVYVNLGASVQVMVTLS